MATPKLTAGPSTPLVILREILTNPRVQRGDSLHVVEIP